MECDPLKDTPFKKLLPIAGAVGGAMLSTMVPVGGLNQGMVAGSLGAAGFLVGKSFISTSTAEIDKNVTWASRLVAGGALVLVGGLTGIATGGKALAAGAAGGIVLGPVVQNVLAPVVTIGAYSGIFQIAGLPLGIADCAIRGVLTIAGDIGRWGGCNSDGEVHPKCACYKAQFPHHKIQWETEATSDWDPATYILAAGHPGYATSAISVTGGREKCWIEDCNKGFAERKQTGQSYPICAHKKKLDAMNLDPLMCACRNREDHQGQFNAQPWLANPVKEYGAAEAIGEVQHGLHLRGSDGELWGKYKQGFDITTEKLVCRGENQNATWNGWTHIDQPCGPTEQTAFWARERKLLGGMDPDKQQWWIKLYQSEAVRDRLQQMAKIVNDGGLAPPKAGTVFDALGMEPLASNGECPAGFLAPLYKEAFDAENPYNYFGLCSSVRKPTPRDRAELLGLTQLPVKVKVAKYGGNNPEDEAVLAMATAPGSCACYTQKWWGEDWRLDKGNCYRFDNGQAATEPYPMCNAKETQYAFGKIMPWYSDAVNKRGLASANAEMVKGVPNPVLRMEIQAKFAAQQATGLTG